LQRKPAETRGFPVEYWLTPEEIGELDYAAYWNDEEAERHKEWYVLDGDFSRMEGYLEEVGLLDDLQASLEEVGTLAGTGLDLAAGTLWAAPHLLAAGTVERLYCLEYSRHRLLKLGPAVLERYAVSPERVVLALGSFYDLHLADGSVDFALMSQALHHADDPDRLLAELQRVLRPGGVAIVIGEHVVTPGMYARAALRALARPGSGLRLGHDRVMGDHFYARSDYRRMFQRHGFRHRRVRRGGAAFQGFVLRSDG
jgi:ubiquinone/menaquinone biosynthesis C-methylase UbiE